MHNEAIMLNIGIFHPTINVCGGAEWVAVNIVNSLKAEDHNINILVNEKIDNNKVERIFGSRLTFDEETVLPFELFPSCDPHNVYTDGLRTLFLRKNCDLVIDTQSNAILPGVNITYIHLPLFGRLQISHVRPLNASYYLPYRAFERNRGKRCDRLVISNSSYTARATLELVGSSPNVLYPPISKEFYSESSWKSGQRDDLVVSVSRIDPWKRLTLIPSIAELTDKRIRFLIIGLKQSSEELKTILRLIEEKGLVGRVEVRTDVSMDELISVLNRSKVLLHTADGEHFGVSIAQAMASGCIPVVHDSGGPKEFVPEKYRFTGLAEAARKIEKAIFGWTLKDSYYVRLKASDFSEKSFSFKFIEMFNSYFSRMKR
jgi:alpha-1,2-mannosyltransferase